MTGPSLNNDSESEPLEAANGTDTVTQEGQATGDKTGLSTLQVTQSVLAAAIGVQSRANKERDFTHGKPIQFIVGGLIFTVLFILCIVLFVQYLLSSA